MSPPAPKSIDLNLLSVLNVVLQEQNVRRAAARLGITPSAVSHALRRLRTELRDPLVVRTARGVVPTARAERLAEPLSQALSALHHVLAEDTSFDPAALHQTFTLSSADLAQFVLLPKLASQLARVAPAVRLVIRPPRAEPFEALARGSLDLTFGMYDTVPEGFRYQALFHEEFLCIVRQHHPVTSGALTLERYLALSHVSVAPRGGSGSLVDSTLAKLGYRRTVALVVPHFLVAPLVVAETDLALMLPARVARHYAKQLPLELLPPPLPLSGFVLGQLWHERTHRDPAHCWLRKLIAGLSLQTKSRSQKE